MPPNVVPDVFWLADARMHNYEIGSAKEPFKWICGFRAHAIVIRLAGKILCENFSELLALILYSHGGTFDLLAHFVVMQQARECLASDGGEDLHMPVLPM